MGNSGIAHKFTEVMSDDKQVIDEFTKKHLLLRIEMINSPCTGVFLKESCDQYMLSFQLEEPKLWRKVQSASRFGTMRAFWNEKALDES
jgi:hypothetical protein